MSPAPPSDRQPSDRQPSDRQPSDRQPSDRQSGDRRGTLRIVTARIGVPLVLPLAVYAVLRTDSSRPSSSPPRPWAPAPWPPAREAARVRPPPSTAGRSGTSPAASATAGTPGSGGTGSAGTAGAGTISRCEADDLSVTLVLPGGTDPGGALLRLVDTATTVCRMTGYLGVDLDGPDDPTFGPVYSVPRAPATVSTITLAPGAAAHAVLHFLTPQDGTHWVPTRIVITPPDTTGHLSVSWSGIPVLRQDAATHPGTYVGPVRSGPGSLAEIGR